MQPIFFYVSRLKKDLFTSAHNIFFIFWICSKSWRFNFIKYVKSVKGTENENYGFVWVITYRVWWKLQWGSEIQPLRIQNLDFLKIRFKMVQFFKGLGYYSYNLTIEWKLDFSKSGIFFIWISYIFFTKWQPSVLISNGWTSRFQIAF